MLNQLLGLYKKHQTNTPLEDFTTEVFVGLLNMEDNIKNSFITDFLKLPKDDYRLKTQKKYSLKNDIDCIVDLVIESESRICFIENKVNSKEGSRQLERYGRVLDTFSENNFETKLFYCTKYSDNKTYIKHDFKQIRWYQIAKFLKTYKENNFVNQFINFLIKHDMAQELTLNAIDFITLENIQSTLNIINDYLDRVKPVFEQTFNTKCSITTSTSQIIKHNRLIYMAKDILGDYGYSEIKYGFQLNKPKIYIGLWIDKSNNQFEEFNKITDRLSEDFKIYKPVNGTAIELKKEISVFLNDEEADTKIADWYKKSFSRFAELINSENQLEWKIKVV